MEKSKKGKRKFHIHLFFFLSILAVITTVATVSAIASALIYRFFRSSFHIPESLYNVVLSTILGGVITAFLNKRMLLPITTLSEAMRKVARGDFSIRLNPGSSITEVQQAYQDFNVMAAELGATETLRSDFISNVSHEFKTPITAIEGYTTLLQGHAAHCSPDAAEYTEKILYNTRRLSGLVSNILLLSKIENQSIPVRRSSFCLDEQLRNAIVSLESKWSEKDLDINADLESVFYNGNEALLMHAWLNLIDNAVKFSPRGGCITVTLRASEENVMVSVKDDGCGISEADKQRIFEKFYQSDTSHKIDGNGLGLALVSRIIAIHSGSIDVENHPEGGCKFTVLLPVSEPTC